MGLMGVGIVKSCIIRCSYGDIEVLLWGFRAMMHAMFPDDGNRDM